MSQFRLCTRKILWLGNCEFPLPYNRFSTTWSFAVPLPYKSFDFKSRSSASAQRLFYDLKFRSFVSAQAIYYMYAPKFSSYAFAHRAICDLKFHSFAQYTMTWITAVPLPQGKTSFEIPHFCFCTRTLLFFGKFILIHPFLNFRAVLHDWWTLRTTEKQKNRDASGKSRR